MKTVGWIAALLLVGVLIAPGAARAAGDSGVRVGVFVHGGYGSYAMADVNDAIAVVNDSLRASGLVMDEVKGGLNFGGGVRIKVNESVSLSAGYERLSGASLISAGSVKIAKFKAPANAITATVEYFLPMSGPVELGVGGGVGYYISAAGFESSALSISEDWKGNAIGIHGLLLGRILTTPNLQVDGAVGYRRAVAKDIKVAGIATKDDLDWSGLMTRLGVTVYLTPAR